MHPSKTEPSVCAICITADRPDMTAEAIQCFRAQDYANKRLLVYDTGAKPIHDLDIGDSEWPEWYAQRGPARATIGELRNLAATFPMAANADIIIHLDSDDYSHANRFSEQVALLQSSGADCVGYNEMLFWDERKYCAGCHTAVGEQHRPSCPRQGIVSLGSVYSATPGEAWLYRNPNPSYALGTSLCYKRSVWEKRPFEATSQGEDWRWLAGVKCVGVSSICADGPRMVARIHGSNTSNAYTSIAMERAKEWSRKPDMDAPLRRLFA